MNQYELNGLGLKWIYEGENAQQAESEYLKRIGHTRDSYIEYCRSIGIDESLNWTKV